MGKKPREQKPGLSRAGEDVTLFLTLVGRLCLFPNAIQNVENFSSLVSAQGVYLFCFEASHVLKVTLKLNPRD